MPPEAIVDPLKDSCDSQSETTKYSEDGLLKKPSGSDITQDAHLFLLIHGLWGNASHMATIQDVIQKCVPEVSKEKVVFLRPSSFQFWKTYDGIGRCAENVVADLFYEIETLRQSEGLKVTKISVLGYSMGGLIARHVIGDLYDLGFFEQVQPIFYTSFATPHVGVYFFRKSLFDWTLNFLGQHGFGKTGPQFFLKDSDSLLVEMSRPESKFMKGLKMFEKRSLMANIKNDRSVAFYTSFITAYSPFDSIDSVHVKYLRNLPSARIGGSKVWPKFVDLATSREVLPMEDFGGNIQEDPSLLMSNKLIRYTIFAFAAFFFLPCYLPLVICLSMVVSLYSVIKVRLTKSPNLRAHWSKVKEAVYYGGEVDLANAKVGHNRRSSRWKETLSDIFKGDTSDMTESALQNMLQAGRNFSSRPETVFEEEMQASNSMNGSGANSPKALSSSNKNTADNGISGTKVFTRIFLKPTNEISFERNDRAVQDILPDLESSKETDYPLFQSKASLPLSAKAQEIVHNLNQLQWAKIAVYHDSFNAHGTIVGRRGGMKNPKGVCTLYLWGSLLRNHLQGSVESTS